MEAGADHLARWGGFLTLCSFHTISLSYNGGKDCLVLLILFLAALHTHFGSLDRRKADRDPPPFPTAIPAIYARPADPFPAVTAFVGSSSRRYHLALTTHVYSRTVSFRDAFARYLAENPQVRAILVGTRRTDPHADQLTFFDPTDGGWPPFVRVHPVIDWRLADIWAFLRADALARPEPPLEYCSMYDDGYTSLGGAGDTLPNPKLRVVVVVDDDDDGGGGDNTEKGTAAVVVRYRPAYELVVDGEERLGRE
jgi:FAD synthetase